MSIVHNVTSKHNGWIGPWRTEPLVYENLTEADIDRDVIFRDYGRAEHGILKSFRNGTVWARFHHGDTAAGCNPGDLVFAVEEMGYAGTKVVPLKEADLCR